MENAPLPLPMIPVAPPPPMEKPRPPALPPYVIPSLTTKLKERLPLWAWKKQVEDAYHTATQPFELLPSTTASELATLLKLKSNFLSAEIQSLCTTQDPNLPKRDLFVIDGADCPAWKYLFDRCTDQDETFRALNLLLAQLQKTPGDDHLLEMAHQAYSAWNPIHTITKTFFAVYRDLEAQWLLYTANERWSPMKRRNVLQEWNLLVEDAKFVLTYDTLCISAALLTLKGSMAMREIHLHGLEQSRKNVELLATETGGAGAGAGSNVAGTSIETSVFYCMYKKIEWWEDLYDHTMTDLPLSDGWLIKHPEWLAAAAAETSTTRPSAYLHRTSITDIDDEI